jgi:hypothetical protein
LFQSVKLSLKKLFIKNEINYKYSINQKMLLLYDLIKPKQEQKKTEILLQTPKDDKYNFYLLFSDHHNHFKYYLLDKPNYVIEYTNSRLGYLPKYIPIYIEKPLLYWQFLPKYF